MKHNKFSPIIILLCAVANPAWSEVPHSILLTDATQSDMDMAQVNPVNQKVNPYVKTAVRTIDIEPEQCVTRCFYIAGVPAFCYEICF